MKYLIERSLFYHFLMQEVVGSESETWNFVAKSFGVNSKLIKSYEKVLANKILDELVTIDDIEMYRNFLNGFFCKDSEFGKSQVEQEVIDAKELAIRKCQELFGNTTVKGNRFTTLSQKYENDNTARVLYALQALYINNNSDRIKFAHGILNTGFNEDKNSDAGLILLTIDKDNAEQTAMELKSFPDIILCPSVVDYLNKQYKSGEGIVFNDLRMIGFGGDKR